MTSYYQRENVVHLDGTNVFRKPEDSDAEWLVARQIEQSWKCTLHEFGALSPVDWYAVRFERMIGVLELKHRSHARATYPTVFLNVRKWLALTFASLGMNIPAVFVVQFTDVVCWVPLTVVDANKQRIAGCRRLVKSKSDIEPVIEIPIAALRVLA